MIESFNSSSYQIEDSGPEAIITDIRRGTKIPRWQINFKRFIDFLASAIALIFIAPQGAVIKRNLASNLCEEAKL